MARSPSHPATAHVCQATAPPSRSCSTLAPQKVHSHLPLPPGIHTTQALCNLQTRDREGGNWEREAAREKEGAWEGGRLEEPGGEDEALTRRDELALHLLAANKNEHFISRRGSIGHAPTITITITISTCALHCVSATQPTSPPLHQEQRGAPRMSRSREEAW